MVESRVTRFKNEDLEIIHLQTEKGSSFTSSGLMVFLKDDFDVMSYADFSLQEMEHCKRRRKREVVPVNLKLTFVRSPSVTTM